MKTIWLVYTQYGEETAGGDANRLSEELQKAHDDIRGGEHQCPGFSCVESIALTPKSSDG